MPKMKTNRAARKRFSITGTGRVRRPSGGASHFMGNKNARRLRRLRKNSMVTSAMEKRVLQLFPYGLP